jgi:hypothetical protein
MSTKSNSFISRLTRSFAIACCLPAAIGGCGKAKQVVKDRANISGTVTLDGKPLVAGVLGIQSAEKRVSTSAMIIDGAYSTDRAPLGKNTVTVDTSSIQFGSPAKYVPIPAKYNDPTTSGFTVEIKAGENENVDFALKK